MKPIIRALLAFVSTLFRSRLALRLEIVAFRHQLTVYQRTTKRPRISSYGANIRMNRMKMLPGDVTDNQIVG